MHRRHFPRWLVPAVTAMVTVAALAITVAHDDASRRLEARHVVGSIGEVVTLETDAVVREHNARALAELRALGSDSRPLGRALSRYETAISRLDSGDVDTAFRNVRIVLTDLEHALERDAERAAWNADAITILVLGATMTVLVLVVRVAEKRRLESIAEVTTEAHRLGEQRLLHLAQHDALTGLGNRALLSKRLQDAIASIRPDGLSVAVILVDLDDFKWINDTLGHGIGDLVLRAVAHRARLQLRATDAATRIGGDEFAFVLTSVWGEAAVTDIANRIVRAIAAPLKVEGHELRPSASVGVTVIYDRETTAEDAMRQADLALYEAKRQGKGRAAVFAPHMLARLKERASLEEQIRAGLARNEFVPHFQPIVDLSSKRILSVEALARWQHPTRGLLGPAEFVEMAEQTGLIVPLGLSILRQACEAMVALERQLGSDGEIHVSVNLSVRQLQEPDVVDEISAVLEETGLPPSRLTLEITESLLSPDHAKMVDAVRKLRDLGALIALDDFGTGYSSLKYLRDFPVHAIKVDRSFVARMHGDHEYIVRTILDLARHLGLDSVAEGVEHADQAARLQALGCGRAQGWLFGKPMDLASLRARLGGRDAPRATA
jgi:diguanylate cyclase (GGDEF)-like protein